MEEFLESLNNVRVHLPQIGEETLLDMFVNSRESPFDIPHQRPLLLLVQGVPKYFRLRIIILGILTRVDPPRDPPHIESGLCRCGGDLKWLLVQGIREIINSTIILMIVLFIVRAKCGLAKSAALRLVSIWGSFEGAVHFKFLVKRPKSVSLSVRALATKEQMYLKMNPVKNVTGVFSCLLDGSLVENETKFDGNPVIFFANAMEIP